MEKICSVVSRFIGADVFANIRGFIRNNSRYSKKEVGAMKKLLVFATCFLMLAAGAFAVADFEFSGGGEGAETGASAYGNLQKYISLQTGTTVSVWNDRGDIFTSSAMIAVGDGTYYIKQNLYPGVVYNFMFIGVTTGTAPNGLTAYTSYYDCALTGGYDAGFFVATSSEDVAGTRVGGAAYYSNQIGGDSRRFVRIPNDTPYDTNSTTGVWIYSNWSSSPVVSVAAVPSGNTQIDVTVGAYSSWGVSEEYKAIDVYGGGAWHIYKSSDIGATYALLASSTALELGAYLTTTDTGLDTGSTYYYIAIASDAYHGLANAISADASLTTQLADGAVAPSATPTTETANATARPSGLIPVYFKVEAPDWDYIEQHDNVVYLTPVGQDGRIWRDKVPGKICRVFLPKS